MVQYGSISAPSASRFGRWGRFFAATHRHGLNFDKTMFLVTVFFVLGTATVVLVKLLMQTKASGIDPIEPHYFKKPIFIILIMFLGMMSCLIADAWRWHRRRRRTRRPEDGSKEHGNSPISLRLCVLAAAPGAANFLSSYLMVVGQTWMLLSVWQMTRGSIVVFTALIRLWWLKQKVYAFEWVGIGVVVSALGIVGAAGVLGSELEPGSMEAGSTLTQKITGVALVTLAEAVQALQTVNEEWLLGQAQTPNPSTVVGLEGAWGLLLSILMLVMAYWVPGEPGSGMHEDILDTLAMLGNNPVLVWLSIGFGIGIIGFNVAGMSITQKTHAVTRSILEAARTFFIWIAGLVLRYTVGQMYGEPWTAFSFMELFGFAVLVLGMLIFYQGIDLRSIGLNLEYPNRISDENHGDDVAVDDGDGKPLLEAVTT